MGPSARARARLARPPRRAPAACPGNPRARPCSWPGRAAHPFVKAPVGVVPSAQVVQPCEALGAHEPRGPPAEVLVCELDAARERLHLAHPVGDPRDVRLVVCLIGPHPVHGDVGVVLDAVGHVRARRSRCRAGAPVHPQHVRRGRRHGLGDPPDRREQLTGRGMRTCCPPRSGGRRGRPGARPGTGRRARHARWAWPPWRGGRPGSFCRSVRASSASRCPAARTGPVSAISSSPSSRRCIRSISSIVLGMRGAISCAQPSTSCRRSIG